MHLQEKCQMKIETKKPFTNLQQSMH